MARFYDSTGRAISYVPTKDGKKSRAPTVADIESKDLRASWTTMIKEVLAAPGLERYKLKSLIESALTLPEILGESLEDRAARVYEDAEAHSKKARDMGGVRHDMFMNVLNGDPIPDDQKEFADKFRGFIKANDVTPIQIERPLVGATSAGRPDLIAWRAPFGSKSERFVVDYKGQELFTAPGVPRLKDGKPVKPFYAPEHWIQCAGYSLDWFENHGEKCGACVIVYCRNTGELFPKFKTVNEMARWREAARLVRSLWRVLKLRNLEYGEEW